MLHISDSPLPDIRVERMAYLSKKKGWEVFFAGPGFSSFALGEKIFAGLHYVPWNRYVRLGTQPYFQWVRWKLRRIVDSIKPDVIHAHNVFSARMVYGMGYPFIFDDHELISLEKKSHVEWEYSDVFDKVVGRYEVWKWGGWERMVSLNAPVVTVSEGIAEFYKGLGAKAFVVPNYPSLFELSKVSFSENKDENFTAVYLGSDVSTLCRPYRNVKELIDIFKGTRIRLIVIGDVRLPANGVVISKGYIPHLNLYSVMSRYHVGLLPWKKHWFHKYANPNKPYLYAHSGMVVVVTSSLLNVIKAFGGRAKTVEDFSDLRELLLKLSEDKDAILRDCKDIKEYAQKHLILENYEQKLINAYENAT